MFSIISPIDSNRLQQFKATYEAYKALGEYVYEFIMPTREYDKVKAFFDANNIQAKLIPYEHSIGYNPSKALNIGYKNVTYDNIIVTSPEVMPKTNVLQQLSELIGQNVLCQVWEQNEDKSIGMSLVNSTFRSSHPGYYFLAMFTKDSIAKINGWDEEFMKGYAFEDDDFGHRFNRAGLKFVMRDDIQAIHQWHPRSETIPNGWNINKDRLRYNDACGTVWATKGVQ